MLKQNFGKIILIFLCVFLSPNFCLAEDLSQSLSQLEATKNLYEVSVSMALNMREKLEKLSPGTPEYEKLATRLNTVEENREQLGRQIPGSEEYKRDKENQSTASPQDDFHQGQENVKANWDFVYKRQANRSSVDEILEKIKIFNQIGVEFESDEIMWIAGIIKKRAGTNFSKQQFISASDKELIRFLTAKLNQANARFTWVNAYILGLKPDHVPSDFGLIRPVIQVFIKELASEAVSSASVRKALINLYQCTRAADGVDDYPQVARQVEYLYNKYVVQQNASADRSCSNSLQKEEVEEPLPSSWFQNFRAKLRAEWSKK